MQHSVPNLRFRMKRMLVTALSIALSSAAMSPANAQYNNSAWLQQQRAQQAAAAARQAQQAAAAARQAQLQQQIQAQQQRQQQMLRQQQAQAQQQRLQSQAQQQRQQQNFGGQRQADQQRRGVQQSYQQRTYAPAQASANVRGASNRNVTASEGRGFVSSGGIAKLTRPMTPGDIKKGFTGKITGDGRALVKFQGRVFAVPARGFGLVPPASNQNARWSVQQKGLQASRIAALASGHRSIATSGGARPPNGGDGKGLIALKIPANSNPNSRIAFAKFFWNSGKSNKEYYNQHPAVDFSHPAYVETLKAGTVVCQHQVPGGAVGTYFAECGQRPTALGISPLGDINGKTVEKLNAVTLLRKTLKYFGQHRQAL